MYEKLRQELLDLINKAQADMMQKFIAEFKS